MGDPLVEARAALAAGQPRRAVDLAWKAVHPAVLAQDTPTIQRTRELAEEIAAASDGIDRRAAEQLATYCAACIIEPHDAFPWKLSGLFGRRRRKRCPDCAEEIQHDARVCRYCGYRYPDLPPR